MPVVSSRSRVEEDSRIKPNQRLELGLQPGDELADGLELARAPVGTDAAQRGHAAQQAVAGELFVEPQHALLEPHGVGIGHDEGDIGRDRADVRDMVVNPLQFEADRAQRAPARRRFHVGGSLDRMAKSGRVREAGVTGNALRQPDAVGHGMFSNSFSVPLCV